MPRLEITTMVGCPLMCSFCPQDGLKTSYNKEKDKKHLNLDNFKLALSKIPKYVRIDFSGMAEPWANPDCTSMLRHTLESGYTVAIYTTLYGIAEDECDEIISLLRNHHKQIDVICLHLPDANGNMKGWKYSIEWDHVFIKFASFGNEQLIARFDVMTMDGSGRPHEALKHHTIKMGSWTGHSRAGSLVDDNAKSQNFFCPPPHHAGAVTCGMTPFYDHNVMLPNGDVILCCMDYDLKHIIGNLFTQNYTDLFLGGELNRLRIENMTPGSSKCSICKSCNWAVNMQPGADGCWTKTSS